MKGIVLCSVFAVLLLASVAAATDYITKRPELLSAIQGFEGDNADLSAALEASCLGTQSPYLMNPSIYFSNYTQTVCDEWGEVTFYKWQCYYSCVNEAGTAPCGKSIYPNVKLDNARCTYYTVTRCLAYHKETTDILEANCWAKRTNSASSVNVFKVRFLQEDGVNAYAYMYPSTGYFGYSIKLPVLV